MRARSRCFAVGIFRHCPCDRRKADELLWQAARRGNQTASQQLTQQQNGLPPLDCREIYDWLVLRCDKKTPQALYISGYFLYHGLGGAYLRKGEATERFRQAAEQGCAPAALALARHFDRGAALEQEALNWYSKAVQLGSEEAIFRYSQLLWRKSPVAETAQKVYRFLLKIERQSADYSEAQYLLGQMDTCLRLARGETAPTPYELSHYASANTEEARLALRRLTKETEVSR